MTVTLWFSSFVCPLLPAFPASRRPVPWSDPIGVVPSANHSLSTTCKKLIKPNLNGRTTNHICNKFALANFTIAFQFFGGSRSRCYTASFMRSALCPEWREETESSTTLFWCPRHLASSLLSALLLLLLLLPCIVITIYYNVRLDQLVLFAAT